jgi:hypothetical protein
MPGVASDPIGHLASRRLWLMTLRLRSCLLWAGGLRACLFLEPMQTDLQGKQSYWKPRWIAGPSFRSS